MKLGITMPTRTVALDRVPQYARWAEEAGLDSAWDWELYRNPFTMLAMSTQTTERVQLGTGIGVTASRSPMEMANAAADIDELCAKAIESKVAAVCIWPRFVPQAVGLLRDEGDEEFKNAEDQAKALAAVDKKAVQGRELIVKVALTDQVHHEGKSDSPAAGSPATAPAAAAPTK